MATGKQVPYLPGRGLDTKVPPASLDGLRARIKATEDRLEDIEEIARTRLRYFRIGYATVNKLSFNGNNKYRLFALPRAADVIRCYAFVNEPFGSTGSPRGGFVALTSLGFKVGTLADDDALLLEKNAYGLTPNWEAAADKGVEFGADPRTNTVLSFTADTDIYLTCVPNANGDLMTAHQGLLEIVFETAELKTGE